ncbi:hypothetical protein [Azospirillum picis]|uniref:BON domain-containing protein n=1 Tax=Azospirillum picis TaxID=488438 RepID=A0ABU0MQ78_9PROT|nr:hypothetical protein [Azospirillum picis]MBP2302077.1 hypothetical protein [Azospirillum picis]MDQ0535632.1 hypothetical protein [Azospirillum picis]
MIARLKHVTASAAVMLLALPFAVAILLGSASPASSQFIDNLDIHLNQQLWNRHQNHQNAERQRVPNRDAGGERSTRPNKSAQTRGERPDTAVIQRLRKNIRTLEARIPQGRRIAVAKDGTVYIHVAGRVDERAVVTFAESLLKTKVILKQMP